jgi:TPR repeat protein
MQKSETMEDGEYSENNDAIEHFDSVITRYEAAASAGSLHAQEILGSMYLMGEVLCPEPVKRDYAKALYWLKRAAELQSVVAQHLLAKIYRDGLGVPTDDEEAERWALSARICSTEPGRGATQPSPEPPRGNGFCG